MIYVPWAQSARRKENAGSGRGTDLPALRLNEIHATHPPDLFASLLRVVASAAGFDWIPYVGPQTPLCERRARLPVACWANARTGAAR